MVMHVYICLDSKDSRQKVSPTEECISKEWLLYAFSHTVEKRVFSYVGTFCD
jgi:hypothetical protein